MITLTSKKNKQAEAVLACFKLLIEGRSQNIGLRLSDFDNGREQGYVIELNEVNGVYNPIAHWAFAEYRSSDDIIIYHEQGIYNANYISEDFWNNRKSFGYGEVMSAAEYIFDEIMIAVNKIEQKELVNDCN